MKVAIPTTQPDMNGQVGDLEGSPYLLVADIDQMDYKKLKNPLIMPDEITGEISLVLRLVDQHVQILLVAGCDWEAPLYLGRAGIQVIEGMEGPAQAALKQFKEFCMFQTSIIPHEAQENERI